MTDNGTQPSRGTIIVDSDALSDLAAPVPPAAKAFGTKTIRRYLDVLPYLARNGYQILIPEIIAYEIADLLFIPPEDGKGRATIIDLHNYFPDRRIGENGVEHFDEALGDTSLKQFFREVAKNRYPNITIVPSQNPPRVDKFLATLRDFVAAHPKPDGGSNIHLQRIQKNRSHGLGDMAIKALLKAQSPTEKIFIFSNDQGVNDNSKGVLSCVSDHPLASALNIAGFISAVKASGIYRYLGLADDVSASAIVENMRTQPINHQGLVSEIDMTREDYLKYQQGETTSGERRFERNLGELTKELEQHLPPRPMSESHSVMTRSRIGRFNQQYPNYQKDTNLPVK